MPSNPDTNPFAGELRSRGIELSPTEPRRVGERVGRSFFNDLTGREDSPEPEWISQTQYTLADPDFNGGFFKGLDRAIKYHLWEQDYREARFDSQGKRFTPPGEDIESVAMEVFTPLRRLYNAYDESEMPAYELEARKKEADRVLEKYHLKADRNNPPPPPTLEQIANKPPPKS